MLQTSLQSPEQHCNKKIETVRYKKNYFQNYFIERKSKLFFNYHQRKEI